MIGTLIGFYLGGAFFEFIEHKAAGVTFKESALAAVQWPVTTVRQIIKAFKG